MLEVKKARKTLQIENFTEVEQMDEQHWFSAFPSCPYLTISLFWWLLKACMSRVQLSLRWFSTWSRISSSTPNPQILYSQSVLQKLRMLNHSRTCYFCWQFWSCKKLSSNTLKFSAIMTIIISEYDQNCLQIWPQLSANMNKNVCEYRILLEF